MIYILEDIYAINISSTTVVFLVLVLFFFVLFCFNIFVLVFIHVAD